MTKAAFAVWESRIAPVFDVVRRIHLVEVEAGKIIRESEETIEGVLPVQKVIGLRELGVDTLICGSISRFFHEMVTASGIQVVSFITGARKNVEIFGLHALKRISAIIIINPCDFFIVC